MTRRTTASISWSPTGSSVAGCGRRSCPIVANGAGDAVAALFLAHHLSTGSAAEAMSLAASAIFGVLNATAEAGASEMLLVEAQEEFVRPSRMFAAHKI